ncbi:MAG: tRNA (5-methylaminomethyl-2-thiouridine)(34)-methyltransferase MnmD [Lewinella sp.]|nr:tRNA (5-methylaminomethyl-2-thiouridine)(34)-methyltransferase MnmD [Lewinella sp.]
MQLFETQDGSHSLFSERFGVSYHSKYGAIQETRHVFIEAGLHYQLPTHPQLSVLEMGFGTGLNALMTALATSGRAQVYYETIEAYPLNAAEAAQLNFGQLLPGEQAQQLLEQLHQSPWETDVQLASDFVLHKRQALLEDVTFTRAFDLVYYDAFAPGAQPELWEHDMLRKIVEAMAPGGVFVTYCAKGAVKRSLKQLGLTVESPPGPPGKREMTRAIKG